jgi:hypothetical protein
MRSRRKKLVFKLLLALLVAGLLELIAFVGLTIFDRVNELEPVDFPAAAAAYRAPIGPAELHFDPQLGWDEARPLRGQRFFPPGRYYASSYGDSFTFGAELSSPAYTFQHQFYERAGRPILNLGTNAAGTDQAYLKLLKYYPRWPTEIVILGVLPENASRLVSVVRKFYFRKDPAALVKPRYKLTPKGELRLLPCPVQSAGQLHRLANPAFLRRVAAEDYWYWLYKDRYGFDLIHGRTFPSLPDAARLIVGLVRYPGGTVGYHTFYDQPDSEPFQLMRALLLRFRATARQRGFSPVIILHAEETDVDDPSHIKPLQRFIGEELALPTVDVTELFRREVARGVKLETLYSGSHYSRRGHGVVAAALERLLRRKGLLKGGPARPKQ